MNIFIFMDFNSSSLIVFINKETFLLFVLKFQVKQYEIKEIETETMKSFSDQTTQSRKFVSRKKMKVLRDQL